MSNSLDIPEDLLEIINDLIIHEDKAKEKNYIDNFQYEYAYDYIDDYYIENPKEESPTVIKISL